MLLLIKILHYCFLQAKKVSDHWPIEIQFKDSSESISVVIVAQITTDISNFLAFGSVATFSVVIALKLLLSHLELNRIVEKLDRFINLLFFSSSHKLTEMRNSSSKSLLQSQSGISVCQRSPNTSFTQCVPKPHCCRKVSL